MTRNTLWGCTALLFVLCIIGLVLSALLERYSGWMIFFPGACIFGMASELIEPPWDRESEHEPEAQAPHKTNEL